MRRLAATVFVAAALGWAATPRLTTIDDVVYKADGAPFEGLLIVSWTSFQTAEGDNIGAHTITLPIVTGVVRLQLVPTVGSTPDTRYDVKYSSDGKIQFEEWWTVAASSLPVRIVAVRVATGPGPGGSTLPPGQVEQITEADVIGLLDDLAARPVKGASYVPLRVAFIDALGALVGVSGNDTDCVRVDGSAGPCGSADTPGFVDAETPTGSINGANAVFMLLQAPYPVASLQLYRNGLLQQQAVDYTLANNVITFLTVAIPQTGDTLTASYRQAPIIGALQKERETEWALGRSPTSMLLALLRRTRQPF